ncbi:energy coupling factor transporter S component ThiW [Clostridia bacterium]|nr:energy coupling factor transporter S component ThiW [Clostridia bacterium]
MRNKAVFKLTLAGLLIALGVAASPFNIPFGAAKCFPVQHLVNVLGAVLLGPWYGVSMAFITSFIRVSVGTGTLLAFPGSMCGAFLCGIVYKHSKNLYLTYLGEVVGTGVVGALLAYPVAAFLLGRDAALFAYVIPFGISTLGGTVIAAFLISVFKKTKLLKEVLT